MAVGVTMTRLDLDAAGLRAASARAGTSAAARRMLALAAVLEGHTRTQAAHLAGMDRQTLRDWVHRYNEDGLEGLYDRRGGSKPCRLSVEQEAEFAALVQAGPDLARDGVARWRLEDLSGLISLRYGVSYHISTISKLLRRLGLRRLSVRPHHPKRDLEKQSAFKKTSQPLRRPRSGLALLDGRSRSGSRTRRGSASKGP